MSILSFIKKVCVQTAVYWEPPTHDGLRFVFTPPREVKVRWDSANKVVKGDNGEEFVASAQIICPEKLKAGGYIVLASLAELSQKEIVNPKSNTRIFEIMAAPETPLFKSATKFVYEAVV